MESSRATDGIKSLQLANEFAERYQLLLDYEKTKGFPNPLVERTNILKYHLALSVQSQENDQHINRDFQYLL